MPDEPLTAWQKARDLAIALLAVVAMNACSDISDDSGKTRHVEASAGGETTTTTTVDAYPQTTTTVGGDELHRLRSLTDPSLTFLRTYAPEEKQTTLDAYDIAFREWQSSKSPPHTGEQVIELLGGVLGNRCVDELQMEWVVVTDQYGTDFAVRGREKEVLSYPFAAVHKRVEDKQHDFIAGVYEVVKQTLADEDLADRED